jgi:predicted amidohydrolase
MFAIAAAQFGSVKGNLKKNIEEHLLFARKAAENSVDVLVFPELSLTGYEPELAHDLAITIENPILKPLREAADQWKIVLIAGCPICSSSSKPYIGAVIIQPNQAIAAYRKHYLHTGEDRYFIPSEDTVVVNCMGMHIGIAICADINNPKHPEDAKKKGAGIYAAGVFMTPGGIAEAASNMSSYSFKYKMIAAMANYATDSGGYQTAGQSSIWGDSGDLLAIANGAGKYLVLARKEHNRWVGSALAF